MTEIKPWGVCPRQKYIGIDTGHIAIRIKIEYSTMDKWHAAYGGPAEAMRDANLIAAIPAIVDHRLGAISDLNTLIAAVDADDPKREIRIRLQDMLNRERALQERMDGVR